MEQWETDYRKKLEGHEYLAKEIDALNKVPSMYPISMKVGRQGAIEFLVALRAACKAYKFENDEEVGN